MKFEKISDIGELKNIACDMRQTALTMIHKAQSGHPGGSLSATDIMTALYFYELNIDADNPKDPNRDRFVLSKGHVCPILYSALLMRGFFSEDNINNLRKYGSILQGHPDMKRTPGVDMSTGSLGQGMSCALGMAIAANRDKSDVRVFTLVGDGESNEGQVWEAAQTAVKYKLDNFTVILDQNGLQNDGVCEDIMPPQDLTEKFRAFGFYVTEIDGHDMEQVVKALDEVRDVKGQPKCIVAKTVKGKGVSFMENVVMWHGVAPNDEQYKQAIKEIEEARA